MEVTSYSKYADKHINIGHILNIDTHCSLCVLGKRVLKDIPIENCTKEDPMLFDLYCPDRKCDEYFQSNYTVIVINYVLT